MKKLIILLLLSLLIFVPAVSADEPPIVATGGITFYYNEFIGRDLKCDGYKYEEETGPWIAVDISWYTNGWVECGDPFLIIFSDGSTMVARALDSGYLDYRLWPDTPPALGTDLPFVADLPIYWREGRKTEIGTIINLNEYQGIMKEKPY